MPLPWRFRQARFSLPTPAARATIARSYPPADYADLVAHVETGLTPTERISLIGDEWAQVRANKATVGDYLDLVRCGQSRPQRRMSCLLRSAAINAIYDRVAATPEEKAALSAWIRTDLCAGIRQARPALRQRFAQQARIARASLRRPRLLRQGSRGPRPGPRDRGEVPRRSRLRRSQRSRQTALQIAARNGDAALFDQLQKISRNLNQSRVPGSGRCACSPVSKIPHSSNARSTMPSPAKFAIRTPPSSSPSPSRSTKTATRPGSSSRPTGTK